MRIESLLVLFLIGSSGCSLLAPSDSELSGTWGVGGQAGLYLRQQLSQKHEM